MLTYKVNGTFGRVIPTSIALVTIPFLIKPIDDFVNKVMDETYRKISTQSKKLN